KQSGPPEERLALAFRAATARPPSPAERSILARGYQRVFRQYQEDRDAALKLIGTGESPRDPSLDVVELAAYTAMANMILNLDEVISKE
ncbi:MAG TPA: hypothetical protein VEL76_09125, partial [Gemmataceae bacterium]|nr:hypothetical protein [Gemmataceae bacterium]